MVASESLWQTERLDDAGAPRLRTIDYSVRQLQQLVSDSGSRDIELFCCMASDPRATVRKMAYRGLARGRNLYRNEDIFRVDGIDRLAGADEAGRGALAGPIVAAAVTFAPGVELRGVADSKTLTPEKREELYHEIVAAADGVSVVFIDSSMIDSLGLQKMNIKALADAISDLRDGVHCAVCDHFRLRGLGLPTYGIPKADATFQCVAAASIVAKVERDRVMKAMHRFFPVYNFAENKGYATPWHIYALQAWGPSEIHRLSFNGVGPGTEEATLWEGVL